MKHTLAFLASFAALFVFAAGAHAQECETINTDRPGITVSPWIVPEGRTQFEIGLPNALFTRGDGVRSTAWSAPFELRYGLSSRVEVRLIGSGWNVFHDESGPSSSTTQGFGDIEIGTKLRLDDGGGGVPKTALALGVRLPTGKHEFSTHEAGFDATFAADWYPSTTEILRLTAGVQRLPVGDDDATSGVLTGLYDLSFGEQWSAWVELGWFPGFHDTRDQAVWGLGADFLLTKDVQLDLAGDFALNDKTPDANLTFGISVRF